MDIKNEEARWIRCPVCGGKTRLKVYFDNRRIPGWMQCHFRLQFDAEGYARMYVFDTCRAFIRTVPLMRFDAVKAEDMDTALEDHVCDEWRYVCMSRPVAAMRSDEQEAAQWVADPLGSLSFLPHRRHRAGHAQVAPLVADMVLQGRVQILCPHRVKAHKRHSAYKGPAVVKNVHSWVTL